MKNVVIGFASAVIILLVILILYTIQGKETRNEEIHDSIETAMTNTAEKMKEEDYKTDEEMTAVFLENVLQGTDSVSDVEVNILTADAKKGILSAEVTEVYQNPNGEEGKASSVRTVILDKQQPETKEERYTATFYLDEEMSQEQLYKTVTLTKGERLRQPKKPEDNKKDFVEWRDAQTGQKAEFDKEIREDKTYYGVWKEG